MSTQVPNSIRKIATEVSIHVRKTGHQFLNDVPVGLQQKWEEACDHELFFQDVERYMGDVFQHFLRERLFTGPAAYLNTNVI